MTDDGHYFAVKKPAWLTTTKKRRRCAQKGRKRKPYRHHGALEVARRPAVRLSHTHTGGEGEEKDQGRLHRRHCEV
jgi:hypothetical protein